ncbi:UNVERIFIED_CONTAM: Polyadenylate-binding protein-interacting protein 11 [Sesamum angustifolium]|uniref:Polyadenylate-binding protein-interacting protein 11 n=1 Tax=Sesamum angustifolium TaxID=2727405 RepID=A0AAW2MLA5_9LAMI
MRELEELFSKLNPMAREFVPPSFANTIMPMKIKLDGGYSAKSTAAADVMHLNGFSNNDGNMGRRGITEEHLAALFLGCGQVVDCRICGDPNSVLRFAFVEFTDEEAAHAALNLSGTMLGYYPVKVLPSRTAIAPVNPTFLPRTLDEREMCSRTVYVTNIDKKLMQALLVSPIVLIKVYRLRLLGDYHHSSRIAFVEFAVAESAIAALNCSGVVLGMLPIRVSPSKTPVRPRTPRPPSQ